jgi:zinc transport system ATP-binding protein
MKKKELISCQNVCVNYGSLVAVENASFSLHAGDYLCVVGANGSGKSTLVKTILGLCKQSSGEIKKYAEGIGYLGQQNIIQRDFPATVREVVMSGCLSGNVFPFYTKSEKQRAKEEIYKLGLEKLTKKPFRELSGGQMQRVLLARAFCAASELLILDEPVNGLDPIVTDELYSIVRSRNRENGLAVLMVSHDIHRAVQNATHILHMNNVVEYFGTAEDYKKTHFYTQMATVETCSTHACTHCGSDCTASHIRVGVYPS